jgi:predicted nucleic acid-binding protein
MPNVVFEASSIVGAALKQDSIPEQALLLAPVTDCRDPKDNKYLELASGWSVRHRVERR